MNVSYFKNRKEQKWHLPFYISITNNSHYLQNHKQHIIALFLLEQYTYVLLKKNKKKQCHLFNWV